MKILSIDYGTKRVGIATADTLANMAFPKAVFSNNKDLISELKKLCVAEETERIILGESKNLNGEDNPVSVDIEGLKKQIESELSIPVEYHPEFYTSAQAARLQGENDMIDASAAAIILQSYLDKYKE